MNIRSINNFANNLESKKDLLNQIYMQEMRESEMILIPVAVTILILMQFSL